jgi:hypothetical protein
MYGPTEFQCELSAGPVNDSMVLSAEDSCSAAEACSARLESATPPPAAPRSLRAFLREKIRSPGRITTPLRLLEDDNDAWERMVAAAPSMLPSKNDVWQPARLGAQSFGSAISSKRGSVNFRFQLYLCARPYSSYGLVSTKRSPIDAGQHQRLGFGQRRGGREGFLSGEESRSCVGGGPRGSARLRKPA